MASQNRYIALLRGINIGKRRVAMADLRAHFESFGMDNVVTYIQTGNVLFESSEQNAATLKTKLEQGLVAKLGYEVPVVLLRPAELRKVVKENPFSEAEMADDVKRYVAFLPQAITENQAKELRALNVDEESYYVGESAVYAGFRGPTLDSQFFGKDLIGKTLGVKPTVRNWKVTNALAELAESA